MFRSKTRQSRERITVEETPSPQQSPTWTYYLIEESALKSLAGIPETSKVLTVDRNYDDYPTFRVGAISYETGEEE